MFPGIITFMYIATGSWEIEWKKVHSTVATKSTKYLEINKNSECIKTKE